LSISSRSSSFVIGSSATDCSLSSPIRSTLFFRAYRREIRKKRVTENGSNTPAE
jgi:hypothetical protein